MPRRYVAVCGASDALSNPVSTIKVETPHPSPPGEAGREKKIKKRVVNKPDGRYLIFYEKA
jgi:hypothetical protein